MQLPEFRLETHFSTWEFRAEHHLTASDAESMAMSELLAMGSEQQRSEFGLRCRRCTGHPKSVRSGLDQEAALDPAPKLTVRDAGIIGLPTAERTQLTCRERRDAAVSTGHGMQPTRGV